MVKLKSLRSPYSSVIFVVRETGDYSEDEVYFGDEPALPDSSKFSHISEEEMQVDLPAMVPPSREVATTEGVFLLTHLFFSSYEHCLNVRLTVICRSCHRCWSCNLLSY